METKFSANPSSRLVYTDFGLISNYVLLFRVFFFFFFCCWKALLKLGANQFSSTFSVPNSGSSFSGYWNEFSTKCYSFRRVETIFLFLIFLLFRANFVLVETIIQIKMNQFLTEQSNLSPNIGNYFLLVFIYIYSLSSISYKY